MKKVLISATDRNLEHYAVNMFKSFRLFDKSTPMRCIVKDVSKNVERRLQGIGVELMPYSYPKSPENMINVSMSVANYLPRFYDPFVMWMDIDALFVDDVSELWRLGTMHDLTALPGMNDGGWITKQKDGKLWAAMGMYVASAGWLRDLWVKYVGYENKAKEPDEGEFIRSGVGTFRYCQLPGKVYYCGRELVERLEYLPGDKKLFFEIGNKMIFPKCLQFNVKLNGKRPQSKAVDEWISDHLMSS